MEYLTGTRLVKLLLIIIMVIQPVSYAYAMAGVSQGHHSDMALSISDDTQVGHHAMNENGQDSQMQNAHEHESAADTCCNTVACCQAFVVSEFTVRQDLPHSQYELSVDTHVRSIDLPAEIKPPRRLLA